MGFLLSALALFCVVLYTYIGYPLLLKLWVSVVGRRKSAARVAEGYPDVSVVITVHNGVNLISSKLENLRQLQYAGALDINFVLDGCSDGTEDAIRQYADGYPFPIRVWAQVERHGKEAAIRNAIPSISGSILMFSDADAILRRDTIQGLVDKLLEEGVGVACGREIHHSGGDQGAGEGQGLFYRYEEVIKRLQEEVASLTYVQGGVFAMWKELYPPEIRPGATQDGIIAFHTILSGKRVAFAANTLSEEVYDVSMQADFQRRIRTIGRAFYAICITPNVFNPWKSGSFGLHLLSSRVLRWFTIPLVLAANVLLLPILVTSLVAQIIVALEIAFLSLAIVGLLFERMNSRVKLLYFCYYFTYIHLAAFIAICKVLLGYRTTTWRPTNS